jgi:AraC family transcriptional regulator
MRVELKTLPAVQVAYLRHMGAYGPGLGKTWERFDAWCEARGFMQPSRRMYGVCLDDPSITPPAHCRYDACVEVDASFTPEGEIGVQTLSGGRYACAEFRGTSMEVGSAWARFFGEWLAKSGLVVDTRPALEFYDTDFAVDVTTGAFTCWLCIPIR